MVASCYEKLSWNLTRTSLLRLKGSVSEPTKPSERELIQRQDYNDLVDKLSELEGRLEAVIEIEDFDEADILLWPK